MGGKTGDFSTALRINADSDVIFPYLTEPDRIMRWMTGVVEVEKLDSNLDEKGDSLRNKTSRVVMINGKKIRFDDEVLRFEENVALSVKSSNTSIVVTSIFQLEQSEPKNGQTDLTYRIKTDNRGIARILAPLRKNPVQGQIEDDVRRLKMILELEPGEDKDKS